MASPAKELRKLRGTDCSQFEESHDGEHNGEGGTNPAGPRVARDCMPGCLQEDRLYYWSRMSQLIRIQWWWKRIVARRIIHAKAVKRRHDLAELFEGECAATIQSAWRRFHTKAEEDETNGTGTTAYVAP